MLHLVAECVRRPALVLQAVSGIKAGLPHCYRFSIEHSSRAILDDGSFPGHQPRVLRGPSLRSSFTPHREHRPWTIAPLDRDPTVDEALDFHAFELVQPFAQILRGSFV